MKNFVAWFGGMELEIESNADVYTHYLMDSLSISCDEIKKMAEEFETTTGNAASKIVVSFEVK